MLTLKQPIENLCEEDISLKEFELFLGKLLSLAVPKVVLCEKRKRFVLLCLQILANETVVDASLLKLTTLYMNKMKEGVCVEKHAFWKRSCARVSELKNNNCPQINNQTQVIAPDKTIMYFDDR